MPSLAHRDDYFETPQWLFDAIVKDTGLHFDLDLCASDDNSKCTAYVDEEMDVLKRTAEAFKYYSPNDAIYCNPPRSKNGKFVNFVYDILWKECNIDVVMLLCWNDMGNKYGEKIFADIVSGDIIAKNLGKVIFNKKGIPSEFPSRLTYFWAWFKHKNI